jgi:hypothetical protein
MSAFNPATYTGDFAWHNPIPMNPLTPEDLDLIESVAEPLGFHLPCYGHTAARLHDSWNKHDIRDRLATLTNTLALVGMSVKPHQSAVGAHDFNYSVIKL